MPNWLVPLICLIALVGFIGFAFRQGTKVSLDRNNTNFGPSQNDGQVDETKALPDYGGRPGSIASIWRCQAYFPPLTFVRGVG